MAVCDPEHVVRRPPVVEVVRPYAREAALGQLGDLLEGELVPFRDHDRIELAVVRAGAGGRIEKRNRLVQVVQDGGVPGEEGVHHGAGQHLRHDDAIAVVVVGRVLAPIDQGRADVSVGLPVAVHIYLAVPAVHFGHWRDECYDAVANLPNERRVLHRQPVGQFHQHFRRAGLG